MNLMESLMAQRLASRSSGGGSDLTPEVKEALLDCFANVAWATEDGQQYYDALADALYGLQSISAVYTQSGTVYDTDSLDSLKADLVVTALYGDGSTQTVPAESYTLSGTLTEGTSTVTVSYGGKTATFSVIVTLNPIPANYQRVEWLQSKGVSTSWISSYVSGKTSRRYELEAKVDSDVNSVNTAILACVQNSVYFQIVTNSTQPNFIFQAGASDNVGDVPKDNNRHLFVLDAKNGKCWVDNSTPIELPTGSDVLIDLWIGKRDGDNQRVSVITFYSLKVYEDDVLFRNYVPCYDKESGNNQLYDLVTSSAIGNINANRGPDV